MPNHRATTRTRTLTLAAALVSLSPGAAAERPFADGWGFGIEAGGVHRADASLDEGGEFSRDSLVVRLSATHRSPKLSAGIALGYEHDSYDFSDAAGLGGAAPWEDVRSVRLSLPVIYRASDAWGLFVLPTLRYTAEQDADLDDGRETGLLAAASYRFSDRLTIGPGIGVFSEIEGGNDVFPILLVDWKITDTLSLETGRGLAASRGPGVTLRWRPAGAWTFSLGARYEKRRFRLADDGPAPDGVGEEKAVPVALGAEYAFGRNARLSLLAGAEFAGSLRLEDDEGNRIADSDFDTAPLVGGVFTYRF